MKNFRKILYLCLLVSPFVLSALFYSKYPDQVAVHWNSQGIADSFVSKNFAAWGIPGILLVIIIFFSCPDKIVLVMRVAGICYLQLGLGVLPLFRSLCRV